MAGRVFKEDRDTLLAWEDMGLLQDRVLGKARATSTEGMPSKPQMGERMIVTNSSPQLHKAGRRLSTFPGFEKLRNLS